MAKATRLRPLRALEGQLRPCERDVAMPTESGYWPIAQQVLKTKSPAERPGDRKYLLSERMRHL
jgi:hypothetical protein